MKTLIKNAIIVNEGKIIESDLLIFNNIIQEISNKIIPSGEENIIDIKGSYLIPGLIGFFFIGVYGGFLQAGVGIVIMLLLTQINRMNLLRTNSVKAFSVFIYSIAAVLIFALDGKILWMVGFWMVLGSVVGSYTV